MSRIDRVEVHAFQFEVENLGLSTASAAGVGNMIYQAGSRLAVHRFAVKIG
jgi:hypothetical protein